MDRRVARTRASLQQAHLSQILQKGYDAVTVDDICRAADVGRSTFYAHYTSKEDLHRAGLEGLRRQLTEAGAARSVGGAGEGLPGLTFSLAMFEHARAHLALYRALAGSRGGAMALDSIRQLLCEVVRAELAAATGRFGDATSREFAVQWLAGAYMAVLTWWLDGGAAAAPQDMDVMFRRLAGDGLKAVLAKGFGRA